jgi:hypothetical protein
VKEHCAKLGGEARRMIADERFVWRLSDMINASRFVSPIEAGDVGDIVFWSSCLPLTGSDDGTDKKLFAFGDEDDDVSVRVRSILADPTGKSRMNGFPELTPETLGLLDSSGFMSHSDVIKHYIPHLASLMKQDVARRVAEYMNRGPLPPIPMQPGHNWPIAFQEAQQARVDIGERGFSLQAAYPVRLSVQGSFPFSCHFHRRRRPLPAPTTCECV